MPSKRNLELLDGLRSVLTQSGGSFFIVNYQGLSAGAEGRLRRAFKEKGATMFVAKNTLIEKALEGLGWPVLPGLKGPTALITFSDPIGAAKTIEEFGKKNDKGVPAAKGGMLSGTPISGADVLAMASLPSELELRAELVGVLQSAQSEMVGVLEGVARDLVGIIDAYAEKISA
jgi:large subunit ribosomal protein L10